ncbi:MAG: EscU/YscU/HrcU family type III secretion system export apparatus switch protein [Thermoguttaceae bacterium]|nr:EscU/YscU/HrcU family type III secretion system export apparatus switch protein [Thermoguttaceae bacterium]
MPEQNGEKSQDPTPHRRQKAREEGSVARSHDLASALLLIAGVGALLLLGGRLVEFFSRYATRQLGGEPWLETDLASVTAQCHGMLLELARYGLPVLGVLLAAGILAHLGQVGFLFLPQKLAWDISRIDPLAGMRRVFSLANVVRLAFGMFKIAVIVVVAGLCLYHEFPAVLGLSARSVPDIAAFLASVLLWTAMKIGIALLVLAVLDYGFQWWRHEQDLKMTPQEVREEMRNLEGDPQILARRRAVQRQLAMNRLGDAVPKADVVVTNPTELAVAIQYDPKTMAAPIVVAKGAGVLAQRIRQLALQHGIPIIERKPLAQALYREVEVNHPVPQDKYAAVAELLAYVYRLKGKKFDAS